MGVQVIPSRPHGRALIMPARTFALASLKARVPKYAAGAARKVTILQCRPKYGLCGCAGLNEHCGFNGNFKFVLALE